MELTIQQFEAIKLDFEKKKQAELEQQAKAHIKVVMAAQQVHEMRS
jgi:hypothetical protein